MMLKLLVIAFICASVFAKSTQSPSVIYGSDDRYDIYEVKDSSVLKNAASVATRVRKQEYKIETHWLKFANFYEQDLLSDPMSQGVCSDEKFANQPTVGDCTGFLISDDLLATAAHCVTSIDGIVENKSNPTCDNFTWIFNYEYKTQNQKINLNAYPMSNIYSCTKVIYSRLDDDFDFAVIKLDRKVKDAQIAVLSNDEKLKRGTKIYSIGHPSGLPKKYTNDSKVLKSREDISTFEMNLDSFGGASGSPIFDEKSHEVVGILVRGRDDYRFDEQENCYRVNACTNSGRRCNRSRYMGEAEEATKIKFIKDLKL